MSLGRKALRHVPGYLMAQSRGYPGTAGLVQHKVVCRMPGRQGTQRAMMTSIYFGGHLLPTTHPPPYLPFTTTGSLPRGSLGHGPAAGVE